MATTGNEINRVAGAARAVSLAIGILATLVLVSFLRFHSLAEVAIVFVSSSVMALLFLRLIPRSNLSWSVIFCCGIAVVLGVYVDVSMDTLSRLKTTLGVGAGVFIFLFSVTRRPAFSLVLCLLVAGSISVISQTKYEYTGVPLLWLDFHLAASTWQFLLEMQSAEMLLVQACLASLVLFIWKFDRKVAFGHHPRTWFAVLLGGLVVSTSAVATGRISSGDEILRTGWEINNLDAWAILIGSFYTVSDLEEPKNADKKMCCMEVQHEDLKASLTPLECPHIVVILEESTFPPDMLTKAKLKLDFFEQPYPMTAEVIGGGTWLSEYALLHGVPPTAYGTAGRYINLLGPGRVAGRLPQFLKQLGYDTTTIYPVHHRFYGASRFHRSLGMDKFVDCNEVPGCGGQTSEVRDARFFEVAEQMLRTSRSPSFIFLPTIRQHSPHSGVPKTIIPCDGMTEIQCGVMAIYSDRLKDSIADFVTFTGRVEALEREVIVLAFGDHIPGDVARYFAESDFFAGRKRTFFTLWSSRRGYITNSVMSALGNPAAVNNAYLDLVIARAAGFNSPYFEAKEASFKLCPSTYCPSGGVMN